MRCYLGRSVHLWAVYSLSGSCTQSCQPCFGRNGHSRRCLPSTRQCLQRMNGQKLSSWQQCSGSGQEHRSLLRSPRRLLSLLGICLVRCIPSQTFLPRLRRELWAPSCSGDRGISLRTGTNRWPKLRHSDVKEHPGKLLCNCGGLPDRRLQPV